MVSLYTKVYILKKYCSSFSFETDICKLEKNESFILEGFLYVICQQTNPHKNVETLK